MNKFIPLLVCVLATLIAATSNERCGQKKAILQQYISHGYTALAGAWPWHGAMFHKINKIRNGSVQETTEYACGVTILTELFVITAAHCVMDASSGELLPPRSLFVKLGLNHLNSSSDHIQQHDIDKIIPHEGYNKQTFEDDIALVKLYTVANYTRYVQPVCLWKGDTSLGSIIDKVGYIVGWGRDENNEYGKLLNEATVPIVSKHDCLASDHELYSIVYHEGKTFCGGYRNGTAAGPGDSGGGLFIRKGNHWLLRGIVSTGRTDPNTLRIDSSSYVVFTDAANYLSWIKIHVNITLEATATPEEDNAPTRKPEDLTNLLRIENCGLDNHPPGTPEEIKQLLDQYPWLAVVEYLNTKSRLLEDMCHGTLIHPLFLVTTAHCVVQRGSKMIRSIRLNDYRLDTITDIFNLHGKTVRTTTDRIAISGISSHPKYNNPKFANNIALIKLIRATTRTPVCLPPMLTTLPADREFSIIGWKRNTKEEKPMIRNVVQLADFTACRSKYRAMDVPLDSTGGQVCSVYNHNDDEQSCSHYMGAAPFQFVRSGLSKGYYFLAGISSFGHDSCKREDLPDVFTNLAHYSEWIFDKVAANV